MIKKNHSFISEIKVLTNDFGVDWTRAKLKFGVLPNSPDH